MPAESSSLDWIFAGVAAAGLAAALVLAVRRPAWVVDRPRALLGVLLVVSAASCGALLRLEPLGLDLRLDPSTEPLLPADDPGQALYRSAVLDFGDDEVYVVALACDEVFSSGCLGAVDRLSDEIVRMQEVRSIGSLMDVTSFRYVPESDWVEVRPFIEDVPTDAGELLALRARALRDPVYLRSIVSEDARTVAINIHFERMTDTELIENRIDERIAEILAAEQ